jgi:hypothetical protein
MNTVSTEPTTPGVGQKPLLELDPAVRRRAEHVFADGRPYRICTRCIMDTSDAEISFDEDGVCSHCHRYERLVAAGVHPQPQGERLLEQMGAVGPTTASSASAGASIRATSHI